MEFCINCGGIIPDEADFCPNCGAAGTKYRLEHDEAAHSEACVTTALPEVIVQPEASEQRGSPIKQEITAQYKDAQTVIAEEQSSAEGRYAAAMLGGSPAQKDAPAPHPAEEIPKLKPTGTNGAAVTGFVFSLLPIPFILSGLLGLIISSVACKRARSGRFEKGHEELAIAGKVLSVMRFVVIILAVLLGFAVSTLTAYLEKQGITINISNLWQ